MPSSSGFLRVVDERNGQSYRIPVSNNVVNGSDLAKIRFSSVVQGEEDDQAEPLKIFDPGYENVAALRSSITFVDGKSNNPSLEFQGYTFQELIDQHDFEDVTHLMIWGSIPSPTQKSAFRSRLAKACQNVPQRVIEVVKAFPPNAPYYTLLIAALSAFLAEQPHTIPALAGRNLYHGNLAATDEGCIRTLAAFYVAVALSCCHRMGQAFSPAVNEDKPMIVNLLHMIGKIDQETQDPDGLMVQALNQIWIQGCDHEINNSTSALLHAASALSDPVSCVITAISSGYGPLHLGAVESVYALIKDIGNPNRVAAVIDRCKATGQRVPGVGHRMYKTWDPRTVHMKKLLKILEANGRKDPLFGVALEMERQVKEDGYFKSRGLSVNIDAYWQFGITALGFPADTVVPLGLACRIVGLLAHWREAMTQPIKLWRPNQVFTGTRAHERPLSEDSGNKSRL